MVVVTCISHPEVYRLVLPVLGDQLSQWHPSGASLGSVTSTWQPANARRQP